ncbi:MAG: two-component sensor histidine kinase [Planctomycetaceae bacterium]|nr:MAG: two-component sensor histidine kinase [Planctomycetaceae bacterium]
MGAEHHCSESRGEDWQSRYAEIARLAGGLAHEIRNPLSTISLNLELLEEDLAEGGSPRERRLMQRVQLVRRECEQLERILNSFLEFARAGELRPEAVSINHQIREFLRFFAAEAQQHGVEVVAHLAAELPLVPLDTRLFQQVLQNLARNAVQAMPHGGRLELLTYLAEDAASEPRVVLELIDSGVGMDPETQRKMYEVFFTTKPGGSGLGLPTVKKIVEAHGGRIMCESERGRGTRFRLFWPVVRESILAPVS